MEIPNPDFVHCDLHILLLAVISTSYEGEMFQMYCERCVDFAVFGEGSPGAGQKKRGPAQAGPRKITVPPGVFPG